MGGERKRVEGREGDGMGEERRGRQEEALEAREVKGRGGGKRNGSLEKEDGLHGPTPASARHTACRELKPGTLIRLRRGLAITSGH
ncbi:hypothetical protein Pmani_003204 [Petrolisthes manimaculis]|uniref:Uncharacterized protein n=1 Tax=Petrolisthes manimaculis TaxID=1843537 RepID=A0AAE1QGR3_9EUCA|nr:hypothetical protein Pmani_003204 [Petrolisthes manimaculis]